MSLDKFSTSYSGDLEEFPENFPLEAHIYLS